MTSYRLGLQGPDTQISWGTWEPVHCSGYLSAMLADGTVVTVQTQCRVCRAARLPEYAPCAGMRVLERLHRRQMCRYASARAARDTWSAFAALLLFLVGLCSMDGAPMWFRLPYVTASYMLLCASACAASDSIVRMKRLQQAIPG